MAVPVAVVGGKAAVAGASAGKVTKFAMNGIDREIHQATRKGV